MEDLLGDWQRLKGRYSAELRVNHVARFLVTGADEVIGHQAMTIAQLRAELDQYHGRQVIHCTDAQLDNAALSSLDEADGTILRATDTGRELVKTGGLWQARK